MKLSTLTFVFTALILTSQSWAQPKTIDYTIVETKPHNTASFTQGLIVVDDTLIETSGLYQQSFITQYDIKTGVEQQRIHFPSEVFAEGVTLLNQQLFVLTWRENQAIILNPKTFLHLKTLNYAGEGWGITHNDTHLITSNGSSEISFRNPSDFSVIKKIRVHDDNKQYGQLNELEYANHLIWANIWQSDTILAINPDTGEVEGILNLANLTAKNNIRPGDSVLNGIAYDSKKDEFWITGKLWPNRYRLKLIWPIEAKK